MPISYKVVERAQPGVAGGGNKIYCAHAVSTEKVSIKKIAKEIEKFSALSEPRYPRSNYRVAIRGNRSSVKRPDCQSR